MPEQVLLHCLRAFAVGGLICVVGQLLFDVANLTPAVTMSILVTAGSILGIFGLYPALVDFAGFGARLPIVNFGSALVEGARQGAQSGGFLGLLMGMLKPVSAGLAAAVCAGFAVALVFRPRS